MRWDKTLNRALNKSSISAKVDTDLAKIIVEQFFRTLKKCITKEDMPKILIKGFGQFMVKPERMKKMIYDLEGRLDREAITEEQYHKLKDLYIEILERRVKEVNQQKRK